MIEIVNLRDNPKGHLTKVDRTTALGNPFKAEADWERPQVISQYKDYLYESVYGDKDNDKIFLLNRILVQHVSSVKVTLACWCAPKACHAEVIRSLVLEMEKKYNGIHMYGDPKTCVRCSCQVHDIWDHEAYHYQLDKLLSEAYSKASYVEGFNRPIDHGIA